MWALLFLVPIVFFGPMVARLVLRFIRPARPRLKIQLGLYHRCLCVFLAYVMLLTPYVLESLAQGATTFAQLDTASWGEGNQDIHYDSNGSLTEKITAIKDEANPQNNFEEKVTYVYNLQNRLAQIIREYDDAGDKVEEFTEYVYKDEDIRVSKHIWSEVNDTLQNDDVTIVYLVDSHNHTGYAQTLEQMTFNYANPDPLTETPDSLTTYIIGDDVIGQTVDGTVQYLLYDGHGSTRQLVHWTGIQPRVIITYEDM